MKKQVILGMATLMFAGIVSTGTVSAAGTQDVKVNYDNRSGITDPDNPDLPLWSVSVPTVVAFTDTVKTQAVDVELLELNGGKLPEAADLTVNVSVKSANSFELKDGADGLAYEVKYGTDAALAGASDNNIAELSKDNVKVTGTATLNAKPTKLANFTDTLTYTIAKK